MEIAMSHTPHELAEEFPADIARMQALKVSDAHFERLYDEYHAVNKSIHRAETHLEPVAEEHEESLRRQRMVLKDEIAAILRATV